MTQAGPKLCSLLRGYIRNVKLHQTISAQHPHESQREGGGRREVTSTSPILWQRPAAALKSVNGFKCSRKPQQTRSLLSTLHSSVQPDQQLHGNTQLLKQQREKDISKKYLKYKGKKPAVTSNNPPTRNLQIWVNFIEESIYLCVVCCCLLVD